MPGPFTYQNNIPAANDELSVSQGDIQQNFASIQSIIDINHNTFSSNDAGKHFFIQFPTGVPTTVTNNTEVGMYSNTGAFSGVQELFFQRANLGANTGYSFTEGLNAAPGWTRLPSGVLLKWGTTTASGAGVVTFPVAGNIPVFTSVFVVIPIPRAALASGVGTTGLTNANFSVSAVGQNVSFYWLAIGLG